MEKCSDHPVSGPHRILRRAGFTLLEVLSVTTILALLLGAISHISLRTTSLFEQQMLQYRLDDMASKVVNRVNDELRSAFTPSIDLQASVGDELSFQRVKGYTGGTRELSPVTALRFQLAPGEAPNGVDDNGNGLPDEGQLLLSPENGDAIVVADNVVGLRFTSTAKGIAYAGEIALTNRAGEVVRRSFAHRVAFRN